MSKGNDWLGYSFTEIDVETRIKSYISLVTLETKKDKWHYKDDVGMNGQV